MNPPDLSPAPSVEWMAAFGRLMQDPYLAKKYDRGRRLAQKLSYFRTWSPELADEGEGVVVDIGPGPGEWLEWVRLFGYEVLGVESPSGDGGMGAGYWQLSQMLHDRQQVPVVYFGWKRFWAGLQSEQYRWFNFQGSWAQCHAEFLEGEPHHVNHDASKQRWIFGPPLREIWEREFRAMTRALKPGGCVVISANYTGDEACQSQYMEEVAATAEVAGLELVKTMRLTHKWRRKA